MQKTQTFKFKSSDLNLSTKKSLRQEIVRLETEITLMHKLATTRNFYCYYFDNIRNFKTNKQCFDYVNQLYYDFFGEYRYKSYDHFKAKTFKHGK